MMAKPKEVNLYGRVIISGNIRAVTGLHIGKGKEGVTIGGVENAVMRDTLTNEPYIPGSSLKGKMRSLAEKREPGLRMEWPRRSEAQFHVCTTAEAYEKCPVCRIYGVPGQQESSAPTRLVVRDVRLTQGSKDRLRDADTDLPFTEVKYEAAIDRVTAAANPRPLERVPAKTVFGPFEMIFSLYGKDDTKLLPKVFEAMCLLEDDYLGGSGSRGSGKVEFKDLAVTVKPVEKYAEAKPKLSSVEAKDLSELLTKLPEISSLLEKEIQVPEKPSKEEDDG
jgi:CRISPR-associated protein Csm3